MDPTARWLARRDALNARNRERRAAAPVALARAERLAEQGGVCAICGGAPADPSRWALDHDHAHCSGRAGTVRRGCPACWRGVLCPSCNVLLGANADDPERVLAGHAQTQGRVSVLVRLRAAAYLERWRASG